MLFYYCNSTTQNELLERSYAQIIEVLDFYSLDPSQKELVHLKDFKNYRLRFDPIEAKEDPVGLFFGQIVHHDPIRFDRVKKSIETVLFKSPILIDSDERIQSEVKNNLLIILGKLQDRFQSRMDYCPPIILSILDEYIQKVLNEDFELEKLNSEDLEIRIDGVSTEDQKSFKKINQTQRQVSPQKLLIFNVDLIIRDKTKSQMGFDWKSSIINLELLRDYWLDKKFISTIDSQIFKLHFSGINIDPLTTKIEWRHKAKGGEYASGLLLDFINILVTNGFISNAYQKRNKMISTIENCFILEDGKIPNVYDKKFTSQLNWTKTITDFDSFLLQLKK